MNLLSLIEQFDSYLLLMINAVNYPFLDSLMWMISSSYFGIPFYVLFLIILLKTHRLKKALIYILLLIIVVCIADLTAKFCFKELFERYRPSHNLNLKEQLHYVNNYKGGTYGFVSSHACNMFALSYLFYCFIKTTYSWAIWPLLFWASLIGYSRIYLGVHFPSDVFVGGLVGILIARILYYLSLEFNWIKC